MPDRDPALSWGARGPVGGTVNQLVPSPLSCWMHLGIIAVENMRWGSGKHALGYGIQQFCCERRREGGAELLASVGEMLAITARHAAVPDGGGVQARGRGVVPKCGRRDASSNGVFAAQRAASAPGPAVAIVVALVERHVESQVRVVLHDEAVCGICGTAAVLHHRFSAVGAAATRNSCEQRGRGLEAVQLVR